MHSKLLFDLSLVAEKVVEYKNPRKNHMLTFADELIFLSTSRHLLTFNVGNKIHIIRGDFHADFSGTLRRLLDGSYHLTLSDAERDFAITYGIRNYGAHRIQNQPFLYNNMARLSQSILNSIFFSVVNMY
jgi:hypothetical protein